MSKKERKKSNKNYNLFSNLALETILNKINSKRKKANIKISPESMSIFKLFLKDFILFAGKESQSNALRNGRTRFSASDIIESNVIDNFFEHTDCIFFRKKFISKFYKKIILKPESKNKTMKKKSFFSKFDEKLICSFKLNYGSTLLNNKIRKRYYIYKKKKLCF